MVYRPKHYKYENGKILEGTEESLERMDAGPCFYCGERVFVSSGQLLQYAQEMPTHKKCRGKRSWETK